MALYALGDMHLAFSVDKPMDRFGKVWKKHDEKGANVNEKMYCISRR